MSRKSKRGTPPKPPTLDPVAAKEAREARRAAREEESSRRSQRRNREALRRQLITVGRIAAVVALLVGAYVFIPRSASYSAGSAGVVIEGVQTYTNGTGHVTGSVTYPQTPPAGGQHNPVWLNCGAYSEPVPNVYGVHALEHGAVWVTYDPALGPDELDALRMHLPSTYVILSPFSGLPAPIVLSAWNKQLAVDSADDERIPMFLEEYWRSQYVPEPGALCSGGIDGPGRVS